MNVRIIVWPESCYAKVFFAFKTCQLQWILNSHFYVRDFFSCRHRNFYRGLITNLIWGELPKKFILFMVYECNLIPVNFFGWRWYFWVKISKSWIVLSDSSHPDDSFDMWIMNCYPSNNKIVTLWTMWPSTVASVTQEGPRTTKIGLSYSKLNLHKVHLKSIDYVSGISPKRFEYQARKYVFNWVHQSPHSISSRLNLT